MAGLLSRPPMTTVPAKVPRGALGIVLDDKRQEARTGGSSYTEEPGVEIFVAWQGTFRSRTGAARMFRLVTTTQGQATLTQSGFDALDGSGKKHAARTEAFLNVELFPRNVRSLQRQTASMFGRRALHLRHVRLLFGS